MSREQWDSPRTVLVDVDKRVTSQPVPCDGIQEINHLPGTANSQVFVSSIGTGALTTEWSHVLLESPLATAVMLVLWDKVKQPSKQPGYHPPAVSSPICQQILGELMQHWFFPHCCGEIMETPGRSKIHTAPESWWFPSSKQLLENQKQLSQDVHYN